MIDSITGHMEGSLIPRSGLFTNLGFGFSDRARNYRIGWRLTSAIEVNLDAMRREAANDNELDAVPVEHGVMLCAAIRW